MLKRVIGFLALLSCAASACSAADRDRGPQGFYLTTKVLQSASDLPSASSYKVPGVSGVFIRIPWDVIQPGPDRYDWALFDDVARRAVASGKKLSIGVTTGTDAPAWLAQAGVPFNQFTLARKDCFTVNTPTFWSDAYIDAYTRMMQAVKDHLVRINAYESVEIVKITGITQRSLELRMPVNNRCSSTVDSQWAGLGYRPAKIVAAWQKMADGVARSYPGKLLVQPILQTQGFPAIDDSGRSVPKRAVDAGNRIVNLCVKQFERRCGIQWNALKLQGPMSERVLAAHAQGAKIGWQTNLYEGPRVGAGCQVDRRAAAVACTAPTYAALLKRGIDLGATFIEVWEPDMLRYPDAFVTAGAAWPKN